MRPLATMRWCMLMFCLVLSAGEVHALDLLDAWHAAMTLDPSLNAARAGLDAGHHKAAQAKALHLPQVTASAGAGIANRYNRISDAQFSAPGMGSASGASFITQTEQAMDLRWSINAQQPLYDVERATSARQFDKQAQLAEVRLDAEQQQLMLRVAQAYFSVLESDDTLATVRSQRIAVSAALKTAKARFEAGDVPVLDMQEAQAREDMLASQELEAESHRQLALAALADLTGEADVTLAYLPEQVDLQRFNAGDIAHWVGAAQDNSPYLRMQQVHQSIAQDEIARHEAAHAPVLNLIARAGGERLDGIGGGTQSGLSGHDFSVGMQLTVPLYSGGMRDARLGEAVALAQQSGFELEALRLKAGQQARIAWQGVSVGHGKVKALEQALHSSQLRLNATRLGYEVGDRTNLDVLNAEQEHFGARLALVRARYQLLLSMLELAASVGELTEQRLSEVNAVLLPKIAGEQAVPQQ